MARANVSGVRAAIGRSCALGSPRLAAKRPSVVWLLADLDPIVSNGRAAVIRKRITAAALVSGGPSYSRKGDKLTLRS